MAARPLTKLRLLLIAMLTLVALLALTLGPPLAHLTSTALDDRDSFAPVAAGMADDVSHMNATPIRESWPMPTEAESQLVALLARARREQLAVTLAGARHSMGGHSIAANGIVIDMLPFKAMSLNADGSVLSVQSGALWSDVIPFLDHAGRSVAIMQSDSSFSVGGSLSVNAHGWQTKRPPMAASVQSLRLLLADGRILRCSREENAELFHAVLGGYGLLGIILDAELATVPNEAYAATRYSIPVRKFVDTWREHVDHDADAQMAYARLRVTHDAFLDDAVLTVYRSQHTGAAPPKLHKPALDALRRSVFRGSVDSDYGKELRWNTERTVGDQLGDAIVSRNQLLNQDVALYSNRDATRTDILHEYFLPAAHLQEFLDACRTIIPQHHADLLNVTLRDVRRDDDTLLRYADQDMFAIVMLFNQARTSVADQAMAELTRALIDAALRFDGRYYLPYRAHATQEQFIAAYPNAAALLQLKQRVDPDSVFRNQFFATYFQPLLGPSTLPVVPEVTTPGNAIAP